MHRLWGNVNEPAVPRSTNDRLGVWLATVVGSVILGLVLEVPWWIPEWQGYVDGLVVGLILAAAVASIASFNAARHRVRQRVSPKWRWPAYLFLAGLLFTVWSLGALITAFAISGGPFGATYSKQFHFAEVETTVYLYDSTFLDPETTVYLRRGWLPLRERVMHLGRDPDEVQVILRGNSLKIGDQTLDVGNRK